MNDNIGKETLIAYYREGKLSLEGLAKKLGISISEAIDRLAELGIEAPVEFDDYLKGLSYLKKNKVRIAYQCVILSSFQNLPKPL